MKIRVILLSVSAAFAILCICSPVLAQSSSASHEEEITLSTYYPAPYGEYEELYGEKMLANRMAVGDINGDNVIDRNDLPANNGDMLIKGNVRIGTSSPATTMQVNGTVKMFGAWETKSTASTTGDLVSLNYQEQALTDGFVLALLGALGNAACRIRVKGYTDSSNPPTTNRAGAVAQNFVAGGVQTEIDLSSFMMPVRKGDYWNVVIKQPDDGDGSGTVFYTIYWIPLGN